MEIEKKRFKGSFLSFFDWNGKSQKKLFFDNPKLPNHLPEVSKQGKETMNNSMSKSQIKMGNNGEIPGNIASCDFNCALSTSSDEFGTKAPGLVARLMGLDSLPNSTVSELSYTSLYSSNSLVSSHCHEGAFHSMDENSAVDSIPMRLKPEKFSWDSMESKAQKVGNPAIRRFQSEMLLPKSAKPIPVTHNKLLSPIKSHSYIQPKNAAHIMEAAAKIIEAAHEPYSRSNGPSSVPLRILDLKEKLEAVRYESKRMANPVNGKPSERSNYLYKPNPTFKGSRDSEKNSSCDLPSKGKSVSQAKPSKANFQSRDALSLNGNRGYMKQNKQNAAKSNKLSQSQKKQITKQAQVMQQKACTGQKSNVLVQNKLKQNSVINKGKSTSKVNSNKPTQTWSSERPARARKTTGKGAVNVDAEPKRSNTRVIDTHKDFPLSKRKTISQKKCYISRDVQSDARGSGNAVNSYETKSIKCNVTTDGSVDLDAFSMKESNDVVSFTFMSPLRRSVPESHSSSEQVIGSKDRNEFNSFDHIDDLYPKNLSLSPPRLHVIDSDALSVLLEKKLQELTWKINPPQCELATKGSSAGLRSSLEDKFQSVLSITSKEQDRNFHPSLLNDCLDSMHDNCSSSDSAVLNTNQQFQTAEPMEEPSCSSNSGSGNCLSGQHTRGFTVFEDPFVSESSLISEDSAYGSTVYSSMQDEEVYNFPPINESTSLENEAKWSEQSSFTVMRDNIAIKQSSAMSNSVDFTRSTGNTELEYIKGILCNAEFMAEEFFMGQTDKIIKPNIFDLLENQNIVEDNHEEYSKLERKAIFDFVSECLELRCRKAFAFAGSCKAWPRWMASVQSKRCLAEELYNEILSFRSMEEEDELVNKDMSTRWGRWLDFDIEVFEEGLELEFDIETSLINELVSDLVLV